MASPSAAVIHTIGEAVRSLARARLRTLLGVVGIMFGIASVIAMISAGESVSEQSRKQFEALGTDILTVRTPRRSSSASTQPKSSINLEDALALADALPGITEAAPRIRPQLGFQYAGKDVGQGSVQGVTAAFARVNRLRVAQGRFVSDLDTGRYFVVVGANVASAIRGQGIDEPVGEFLEIEGRLYSILGVLEDMPEAYALPFQVDANESVFVPVTTVRRIQPDAKVELIVARTAPGVHYLDAVRDVRNYFAERARDIPLDVISAEHLVQRMESQLGLMTLLLGVVGGIALLIGGVGVMNMMIVSVAERRGEIGVRRALGATRRDIQHQFLIESLLLALAGGLAGIALGTVATWGICSYFGWEFILSTTAILAGFGTSTAVGIFFGFQPAWQASRLDPIVALQGN